MAPPRSPGEYPSVGMFKDVVKVQVGQAPAAQTFTVHRGVASFYSGYFEAATKDCFKEGQSGVIELPTEETEVFERYTREWDRPEDTEPSDFLAICKLWTFADRRQVPLLMDDMIDELHTEFLRMWCLPITELKFIYENTTDGSKLRKFILAKFTQMFTLHKGVASFYSGYFETATRGEFKEGKSGMIQLPTEEVDIFGLFVGWMYTRKLPGVEL
ncbi:hypothetical protein LTR08_008043 [Meristemomyces frigidus]|nr:hypothetical protein LTR08_008043 [Meristemomyces frigidus]